LDSLLLDSGREARRVKGAAMRKVLGTGGGSVHFPENGSFLKVR